MKKLLSILRKRFHVSFIARIENAVSEFSITEKVIFSVLSVVIIFSGLSLLHNLNNSFLVEIPSHGGSLTEGVVGAPHFINPLFATSDIDRDIVSLVYSGLMRVSDSGDLIPDLATSYTLSPDGKTYDFTLRDNAVFHDGESVTTEDIAFTIQKATDPTLKSPRRANWEGVEVEVVNEKQIRFHLKQPYAPFLNNTTLGILPKHLWKEVSSEQFTLHVLNTEPVGSGPYTLESTEKNGDASIRSIAFDAFKNFSLSRPYISNITLMFFETEDAALTALKSGDIQSLANISSKNAAAAFSNKEIEVHHEALPRIFGVFFNQNQAPLFLNKEVRDAFNLITDRDEVVNEVFNGYGSPIYGPLPLHPNLKSLATKNASSTEEKITRAKQLLEKAGWKINADGIYEKTTAKKDTYRLAFSISTSNSTDLIKTAETLKKQWEKIGAKIEIKIFDIGDLNQVVIRPRKYDALLFGEIIGRDMDPYAFWHSSQRNDPGLNIALYTNSKVDKFLEDARTATSTTNRYKLLDSLQAEIVKETPAIFLYSPDFIYAINKTVKHQFPQLIFQPSDRFTEIQKWHVEIDKVWDIDFLKQ